MTLTALVLAAAAAFPAAASAKLSPTVSVTQSSTTAAATASATIDITFNQTTGDAVKDVSITTPPGALINENIAGGACLTAGGPTVPCQIGAGSVTLGTVVTPAALYLVRAPKSTDVGGVALVAGALSVTGDLTFRSSQEIGITPALGVGPQISFDSLPASPVIGAIDITLSDLVLPSSCPSPSSDVVVWADSDQAAFPRPARAPFTVTGCGTLAYQPTASAIIAFDSHSDFADVTLSVAEAAGDSTSQEIQLTLPSSLSLNPAIDPCLEGELCTIGTVSASSPVLPSSILTGTITLSGTQRDPLFAVSFPPPLNLRLASTFNGTAVGLNALPDIPLTSITLNLTGNALGRVFIAQCVPKNALKAVFSPRTGLKNVEVQGNVLETGCTVQTGTSSGSGPAKSKAGKPKASAALSGVAGGASRLSVRASRGSHAPDVASLSITLPHGLSFARAALKHVVRQALALSGATMRSAKIVNGALVVVFKRAVATGSVSLGAPLLVESRTLAAKARTHKVKTLTLGVRVTDSGGTATALKLTVKA
jgi:hypothetical protein